MPLLHRADACGCWLARVAVFLLLAGIQASHAAMPSVVVLANARSEDSMALARHYMERRNIPESHLCALDLTRSEVVSRRYYNRRIRDPLLAFLREQQLIVQQEEEVPEGLYGSGWRTTASSVQYLVCMFDTPLRIADTDFLLARRIKGSPSLYKLKNTAALDSELSLLLEAPYKLDSATPCPMFELMKRPDRDARGAFFLVTTRLDGPGPEVVRRMIDEAVDQERYGLLGRCYFDAKGTYNELGDNWIYDAYERFRQAGYECVIDENGDVWGEDYPMENAVVYMGWYAKHASGPFKDPSFRFEPGALAVHIYSGAAKTLKTRSRYWVGPFLDRGAVASMGGVSEPFLALTPHLNILADRLCRGVPFGDSVYMALRAVSWQIAIVGDPLYRPFRYTLDEQVRHLEEDDHPGVAWGWLRRINTMVRNGRLNPALDYCRGKLAASGSPLLREKLAELYARNGLYQEAGEAYGVLLAETDSPATAVRVAVPWIRILNALGYQSQAAELAQRIRLYGPAHRYLPWFEQAIQDDEHGFILNPPAATTDTPAAFSGLTEQVTAREE